ncbi:MAG: hypothetical protein Q9163_001326 [Psora crenata]
MLDPALEDHSIRYSPSQVPHGNNGSQRMQNQKPMAMANGFHQPIQQQQQQPQPQPQQQPQQQQQQLIQPRPMERSLPPKEVTEENIDTAYVQFILYCNPSIPADVETEELKKGFRNPPKSDGNSFSPWTLFGLLQRLENKEIKTWSHLVMELGVEPPDPQKNQSAQKVQQYAVRLKRWLHAYHIDAFFNYLTSKPSSYYTERPQTDAELAETTRDNVPPEEDLAVRALLPEWRPKRGRRKAEDINDGGLATDAANAPTKRQNMRASSADFTSIFDEQYSSGPSSALPWSAAANSSQGALWNTAHVAIGPKTPSPSQQHQTLSAHPSSALQRVWHYAQPNANSNNNNSNNNTSEAPSSPYPQSAITPRASFLASPAYGENEPKSAHPSTAGVSGKSPSRKRKRHAPAISSAWNATGTPNGKIRGRPPSNRNVQDGPFSTFPVNPSGKEAAPQHTTTANAPASGQARLSPPTAVTELGPSQGLGVMADSAMGAPQPQSTALGDGGTRKPSKLQLQVPSNPGNPIRLATPPRVLINGESNFQPTPVTTERRSSTDFFNQLDEISEADEVTVDGEEDEGVDWKKRCLVLRRKLAEKEEELRAVKRRVLDALTGVVP